MSIQPEGEALRKATKWIAAECLAKPGVGRTKLIEQACLKFDLSPSDAEFLARFLAKSPDHAPCKDPS